MTLSINRKTIIETLVRFADLKPQDCFVDVDGVFMKLKPSRSILNNDYDSYGGCNAVNLSTGVLEAFAMDNCYVVVPFELKEL